MLLRKINFIVGFKMKEFEIIAVNAVLNVTLLPSKSLTLQKVHLMRSLTYISHSLTTSQVNKAENCHSYNGINTFKNSYYLRSPCSCEF
jgi:hypothetical protein